MDTSRYEYRVTNLAYSLRKSQWVTTELSRQLAVVVAAVTPQDAVRLAARRASHTTRYDTDLNGFVVETPEHLGYLVEHIA